MEKWIVCEKCGTKLAKEKDGWLEIRGRTNFKSNGVTWTFACKNSKCTHKTVYNLK